MEYEKSYIFEPSQRNPAKRQKIEPQGLQASWETRRKAFEWSFHLLQERINENLNALNATTVTELSAFLDEQTINASNTRIPTAIISIGPHADAQSSVVERVSQITSQQDKKIFVSLKPGDGSNLKALLKVIIQRATARADDVDEDDEDDQDSGSRKRSKLLNYDLEILSEYVRDHNVKQIVIAIQETEVFDNFLLSDVIETLGYWRDRIPLCVFLNVASSVESLQQRFSKDAIKCLQSQLFDVAPSGEQVEQVFEAVTQPYTPLWIGAGLMRFAIERQNDYIQNITSFVDVVKYAYMSCYWANALSIFLDPCINFSDISTDHFEAARNVDSFRVYCQKLLETDQLTRLRDCLKDDLVLFASIRRKVNAGRNALRDLKGAVHVYHELQLVYQPQKAGSKSALYIQAMSNKLKESSVLRELLLSIRKAPSSGVKEVLDTLCSSPNVPRDLQSCCRKIRTELAALLKDQDNAGQPLRSEDDVKNSTLRTTVIAQKVELSKQKASLSKQDEAYTAILRQFTDLLEMFFREYLIDPTTLTFHEIFLYDLKSPHREVFAPRPRHAVERALSSPHDYLDCECCGPSQEEDEDSTLAAGQPPTAVLYQLYLESGSLINVHDLFQAFQAVNGDERSEEQNKALFHKALAELEHLGLVKGTRRRVDHVAKVAWKGL